MVELESGDVKTMTELEVGDRVRVGPAEFSEVYLFTHKDPSAVATFVTIVTSANHTLSLTPGHYVYVNGKLKAAGVVEVGDVLEDSNGA